MRRVADRVREAVLYDSAFAENAYFIKMRERGMRQDHKRDCEEMFSYADFMTMSSKKGCHCEHWWIYSHEIEGCLAQCSTYNIMFEGYITYGGMSGGDMNALAVEAQTKVPRIRLPRYPLSG